MTCSRRTSRRPQPPGDRAATSSSDGSTRSGARSRRSASRQASVAEESEEESYSLVVRATATGRARTPARGARLALADLARRARRRSRSQPAFSRGSSIRACLVRRTDGLLRDRARGRVARRAGSRSGSSSTAALTEHRPTATTGCSPRSCATRAMSSATSCFSSLTSAGLGDRRRQQFGRRTPVTAGLGSRACPLLESMVRALARDPERLDHVARLIESLSASEEGRALIPEVSRRFGSRSGRRVRGCGREARRSRSERRLRRAQGLPARHRRVRLRAGSTPTDADGTSRFLVADEVGLGKTLVARGLIAKTIEHLAARRPADRRRLRLLERRDRAPEHPTPERHGQGRLRPRVADHAASAGPPSADAKPPQLRVVHAGHLARPEIDGRNRTRARAASSPASGCLGRRRRFAAVELAASSRARCGPTRTSAGTSARSTRLRSMRSWSRQFARALERHDRGCAERRRAGIPGAVRRSARSLPRQRKHWPGQDLDDRRRFVGALCAISSRGSACNALEPDLIILDEFQRFKHLLRRMSRPASSRSSSSRSATTVGAGAGRSALGDAVQDVHGLPRTSRTTTTRTSSTPSVPLRRRRRDGSVRARPRAPTAKRSSISTRRISSERSSLKATLERKLRRVMVRTERLSTTPDRNGMLVERRRTGSDSKRPSSRASWRSTRSLAARCRRRPRVLEVGAVPAQLHGRLQAHSGARASMPRAGTVGSSPTSCAASAFSAGTTIERYRARSTRRTRGCEASWPRSSTPRPGGCSGFRRRCRTTSSAPPFDAERCGLHEAAGLLGLGGCAEGHRRAPQLRGRAAHAGQGDQRTTYSETRAKLKPLLRFSRTQGAPAGLPVLGSPLPQPGPRATRRSTRDRSDIAPSGDRRQTLEAREGASRERDSSRCSSGRPTDGPVDETWYWATPFLLDSLDDPEGARRLAGPRRSRTALGEALTNAVRTFARHVDAARRADGGRPGRPPDDLSRDRGPTGPGRPGSRRAARSVASRRAGRPAFDRAVGPRRRGASCLGASAASSTCPR